MITIEFDPGVAGSENALPFSRARETLERLLDRCESEGIRDIGMRFPATPTGDLESVLCPLLGRAFRFSGWFRTRLLPPLARRFLTAGHRVTIACTNAAGSPTFRQVMTGLAEVSTAPRQITVFLALPAPPPGVAELLDGVEPRAGIDLTLGLAWNGTETGPSPISPPMEREWAAVLLGVAAWATERGVILQLACGLPLCLWTTEQLGRLALSTVRPPLALCTPGLVVTLDGRARACPRLPATGWVTLPADVGLRDLASQLIGPSHCFAGFCGREGERDCLSRTTGACGAGCMAQNALAWQH